MALQILQLDGYIPYILFEAISSQIYPRDVISASDNYMYFVKYNKALNDGYTGLHSIN